MPRRLGLTLVAVLAGLALLTAAHAQVRFEGTPGAFPPDEDDEHLGPEEVGFNLRLADDGNVVFVLVQKGKGALPDALTGFYGYDIPKNAIGRVDAVQALQRCAELVELTDGIVVIHDDVSVAATAAAYVSSLEAIGLTKVDECYEAGWHTVSFQRPDGAILRLRLTNAGDGVQAYFGL